MNLDSLRCTFFFFPLLDTAMAPCRQAERAAGARLARVAPRLRHHPRLASPCATHASVLAARARDHSPLQLTTTSARSC